MICQQCKNIFTPYKFHPDQKFCSKKCRKINYNKVHQKERSYQWAEWYKNNKDKVKNRMEQYRLTHKKEIKIYGKEYKNKNQKKINRYRNNKLKTDINFKLSHYLRSRMCLALKGNPKLSTTIKLVDCSIKKLKQHLEKQFKQGMTWNNYGKWHIDHIRPCASFDLSKPEEQHKCFNWKNLQPLWATENCSKGTKNYQEVI